jgi:hypothetical protein
MYQNSKVVCTVVGFVRIGRHQYYISLTIAFHKSINGISCRIPENQTLLDAVICHCVCSFHFPFSFGYKCTGGRWVTQALLT